MSGKKGRHPPHEEHVDESWLVPYADILTLLLALFIVLFAVSNVDQEKMEEMKRAFDGQFNPGSMEQGGTLEEPGDIFPGLDNEGFEPGVSPSPPESPDPTDTGEEGAEGMMGNIYTSLQGYIQTNNLENTVKVEYAGENILLTMQNDIMFASGSASLSTEMKDKGRILAQILKDNQNEENPFEIIVAGHTDSIPIATSQFPSNQHLSAYRAVEFQLFLIIESGLNPVYFSARGYGELHPIDTNETSEGRARNRRVELLISQRIEREGDGGGIGSS